MLFLFPKYYICLQSDFNITYRIGLAGMDIAKLFVSQAQHDALGQKHTSGNKLHPAKAALAAAAADINTDTGAL